MAQYMKALFEGEFESEEASMTRALRRVMPTDSALAATAASRPDYQETMVLEPQGAAPRPKRWLWVGLCFLMILAAGTGFWYLNRPSGEDQDGPVVVHVPINSEPQKSVASDRPMRAPPVPPRSLRQNGEAPTPVSPPSPAPNPRIAKELEKAEQYLQAWNLTAPAGSNAYDTYREILKRDPDNTEARQGIKKVGERYADLAAKEIKRGKLDKAMGFIKTGLEVDSTNRRLWGLREKVNLKNEQTRQMEIQRLLIKANDRIAALRLTKPPRDNALHFLRQVQKMDPDNAEARRGLRKIGDRYAALAEKEMNRFRYDDARRFIDTGLKVDPRHKRLLNLRTEINKRIDQRVMRSLKNIFN
jgi:hypothetical protein